MNSALFIGLQCQSISYGAYFTRRNDFPGPGILPRDATYANFFLTPAIGANQPSAAPHYQYCTEDFAVLALSVTAVPCSVQRVCSVPSTDSHARCGRRAQSQDTAK